MFENVENKCKNMMEIRFTFVSKNARDQVPIQGFNGKETVPCFNRKTVSALAEKLQLFRTTSFHVFVVFLEPKGSPLRWAIDKKNKTTTSKNWCVMVCSKLVVALFLVLIKRGTFDLE